jgi:hypothetical protein
LTGWVTWADIHRAEHGGDTGRGIRHADEVVGVGADEGTDDSARCGDPIVQPARQEGDRIHLHLGAQGVLGVEHGAGSLGRLDRLMSRAPIVRYERERPGERVHLDTKMLGRIGPGGGHRIPGIKVNRHRGIGWNRVHLAIDDHSRLAYAEGRTAADQPRARQQPAWEEQLATSASRQPATSAPDPTWREHHPARR